MNILKDVRVLDLGSYITAPYAAMLLAELGADVIKVEKPGTGDPFREFSNGQYSSQFQAHNRNKRSVTLDCSQSAGQEVLDALISNADVLLTNMRPGVEEKLGIGAARLRALNPRLVYCSITGFGSDGPYSERPAYDNVGQALSGWLSMFHEGADARVPGPAVSDSITGLFAAMGILAALVERSSTGHGRHVEVSMLEAMIAFAAEPLGKLFATEKPVPLYGRAAASQSFIVTCKDGKRIGLHLSSPEKFWKGLVLALGREDLMLKFPDRASRVQGYDALARELANAFITRDRDGWLPLLEQHDVPFAPELRLEELENDPQVQFLEVFGEVTHAHLGTVKSANRPIRYDGNNRSNFTAPPALGEHTQEVLRQAGLTDERIAELRLSGVI